MWPEGFYRREARAAVMRSDHDDDDPAHGDGGRLAAGARCRGNNAAAAGRRNGAPRTVFTRAQLDAMEDRFVRQSFLTREERIEFADEIQLTERQILVWFQNRR